VSGLLGADVARIFELAQVGDEVAGGQADHVLQPGERERVTCGEDGQGRDDSQPGWDMDERVEFVGRHVSTSLRCCTHALAIAPTSEMANNPIPTTAHDALALTNSAAMPTLTTASAPPNICQSCPLPALPATVHPTITSGAAAGKTPYTIAWLAPASCSAPWITAVAM